jgi:hypothetical protein
MCSGHGFGLPQTSWQSPRICAPPTPSDAQETSKKTRRLTPGVAITQRDRRMGPRDRLEGCQNDQEMQKWQARVTPYADTGDSGARGALSRIKAEVRSLYEPKTRPLDLAPDLKIKYGT